MRAATRDNADSRTLDINGAGRYGPDGGWPMAPMFGAERRVRRRPTRARPAGPGPLASCRTSAALDAGLARITRAQSFAVDAREPVIGVACRYQRAQCGSARMVEMDDGLPPEMTLTWSAGRGPGPGLKSHGEPSLILAEQLLRDFAVQLRDRPDLDDIGRCVDQIGPPGPDQAAWDVGMVRLELTDFPRIVMEQLPGYSRSEMAELAADALVTFQHWASRRTALA